jgi:hypothetical protein
MIYGLSQYLVIENSLGSLAYLIHNPKGKSVEIRYSHTKGKYFIVLLTAIANPSKIKLKRKKNLELTVKSFASCVLFLHNINVFMKSEKKEFIMRRIET